MKWSEVRPSLGHEDRWTLRSTGPLLVTSVHGGQQVPGRTSLGPLVWEA